VEFFKNDIKPADGALEKSQRGDLYLVPTD